MPHNGFRGSRRFRFPLGTGGRTMRERFTSRVDHSLQDESRDVGIRMDLVNRVREKLAMGIYDQPSVFEKALDVMFEEMEA